MVSGSSVSWPAPWGMWARWRSILSQIEVINDVFTPSPEVVEYQRKVLAAFEAAESEGKASIAVDGKMVDYAVARVARAILARAEAASRAR